MMPEGPEVKAAVYDLRRAIGRQLMSIHFVSGRYFDRSPPDGYGTSFRLPATILDWNCKGKFMYLILSSGSGGGGQNKSTTKTTENDDDDFQQSIWITLGMTGRFISEQAMAQHSTSDKQPHVRWYMEIGNNDDVPTTTTTKLYYEDARNFGTLKFVQSRQRLTEKLETLLGPDVLTISASDGEAAFLALCEKYSRWNICRLLMDQGKIAGIGNYILAETLYRANINPYGKVETLSLAARKRLFHTAQHVAKESYQSLVGDTTTHTDFEYQVYGRKVTHRGEPVRKDTKGPHGRTIWYTDQQLRDEGDEEVVVNVNPAKRARCSDTRAQVDGNLSTDMLVDDFTNIEADSSRANASLANEQPRPSTNSIQRTTKGNAKLAALLASMDEVDATAQEEATTALESNATKKNGMTRGNAKLASILSTMNELDSSNPHTTTQNGTGSTPGSPTLSNDTDASSSAIATSLLESITEPGWKSSLVTRLESLEQFSEVARMLALEEQRGEVVYPPRNEIFAALNLCPFEKLKVVIVGQDPYHAKGQGHGLAFSVRKRVRAPPSLQNIFRELSDSVGIEPPTHGNLEHWARQGVLLLNSVLTVREGQAYSHSRQGWEQVSDLVVQVACENHEHLVFLLWGNAAAEKVRSLVDTTQHTVIRTSHPSPLGATKTKSPFLGSGCFRRANNALISAGFDSIDWNVSE